MNKTKVTTQSQSAFADQPASDFGSPIANPAKAQEGKVTLGSVRAKRRDRKMAGKTALADDELVARIQSIPELPSDLADEDAKWREEMRDKHVKKPTPVPVAAAGHDKVAADTARYEALAREHGADLSEEGFNEALKKAVRLRE